MDLSTIWKNYIEENKIIKQAKPLFDTSVNLEVKTLTIGKRKVLKRSESVDELIANQVDYILTDHEAGNNTCEGILYLMFRIESDKIIPHYVGISQKYGKKGKISSIMNSRSKKPRWDYYGGYHIGNLSTVVCDGYEKSKIEKDKVPWAEALFETFPSTNPKLKNELFLWYHVWTVDSKSIWKDFGHSSLVFEEALMIELLGKLFPNDLINKEGILRRAR